MEQEDAGEEEPLVQAEKDQSPNFGEPDALNLAPHVLFVEWMKQYSEFVWIILFSGASAVLIWWIPTVFYRGVNVTALCCNMCGAILMAAVTTFQQVRHQSAQTYSIYKAVKFGFCAVLTNFSILIEDSERLLHTANWWLSPLNLIVNISLAMLAYQAARLASLRFKAGAHFSLALLQMENEERRMKLEIEVAEQSTSAGAKESEIAHIHSLLREHQQTRVDTELTRKHYALLLLLVLLPAGNWLIIASLQPTANTSDLMLDYTLTLSLSILGAVIARHFGTHKVIRTDVQWRTFRVNMASCILIATAHNVLFFRNFIPSLSQPETILFLKRFVQSFCGSLSSFAELIDETAVLINSKICPRDIVFRNIFYNLILCLAAFLCIVYLASGVVSLIWAIPL
eukprot:c52398_g1_i1.p1 GENE.c52398_g1_i1~~c52398_g1_i1.p1  ORF type:complete len:399 (-),score=82.01 c52398_g1_i1:468-1664(-)